MSRQNVELLHQAIDTFNQRDLDAFLALNDPGVEFTPYERALEGLGLYRGHDGIWTWWEESFAALPGECSTPTLHAVFPAEGQRRE